MDVITLLILFFLFLILVVIVVTVIVVVRLVPRLVEKLFGQATCDSCVVCGVCGSERMRMAIYLSRVAWADVPYFSFK